MKEQTLHGKPIIIIKSKTQYVIYYEGTLFWMDQPPPTDQELDKLRSLVQN